MMVLDTNTVIYYIEQRPHVIAWIDEQRHGGEQMAISTITIAELLGFPRITPSEIFHIEQWLGTVLTIDVDVAIAREAGRLRRLYRLTTSDGVIAATAVILQATLVTYDIDLKKIRDITVVAP